MLGLEGDKSVIDMAKEKLGLGSTESDKKA